MPGIFGFIRKRDSFEDNNRTLLEGMKSRLSHNPNYESEIFSNDLCGVGNIGLPFFGEQRLIVEHQKAAAFSGYIYGWNDVDPEYSRVTPNKAERLLRIFEKYGQDLPKKIDGSYNAVVIDLESKETFICNDRFGHRQLYYYEDNDLFLFSTEFKAFLAYDGYIKNLNLEAVSDYFNFGYVLGDKTFFKGVKLLRGGDIISISNGKVSFSKYWDYSFGEESKQSVGELIEEADSIYRNIIKKRVGSAKTVIIPLSGGLDSRFITAHTVQAGVEPFTFTHGRKGCSDHRIADKVAGTLNIRYHKFIEIDPTWLVDRNERFVYLTEGMIESTAAVLLGIGQQYGLSAVASVFLNGIYGGPGNFGSVFFNAEDVAGNFSYEQKLQRLRYNLGGNIIDAKYYGLFLEDIRSEITANCLPSIEKEFQKFQKVSDEFYHQKDVFFIKNNIGRYMNQVDCNRYIWHDHFALADDRLVDFYIKLPAQLHFSRAFMMEYFKAKFPHLAKIPYQKTGVDLYSRPSQIRIKARMYINKAKYYTERLSKGYLRFYDMDSYTHHNQAYRAHRKIRSYYEQILLDNKTLRRGYFDRKQVEALLKRQREGGNSIFVLSSLLAFELFNRLFVDK